MKKFGIDISKWQGNFDLSKAVKEGVEFVIIKGGGGDSGLYIDSKFSRNYEEAKRLKLPVGVYWFSKALTVSAAQKEADYFYNNVLKGKQFELPVYIDVENKTQLAIGKRLLTDVVKAWCDRLEKRGYKVGIYSSQSYFSNYMYDDELKKYEHWVACWATSCNYANKSCFGMWQFGGETNKIRNNKVAGQVCDQDYMYFDYPEIIKEAGLNGFEAAETKKEETKKPTDKKTISEIAKEVVAGKWGNGDERKKKLTKAGYNYADVQAEVNKLLSAPTKKTISEIAKEVVAGKWGNGEERKKKLTEAGYNYKEVQAKVNEILK